ncbi:MAG: class I SAM-dependent methyltransferase [Proteobacteria bacterium]|nr:class I SAM-dependent methyltransferase [Pseudomonadota bacterium]
MFSGREKHGFVKIYEEQFAGIRNQSLKIFELGVWQGDGLKWLADYFPNAEITGLDKSLDNIKGGLSNDIKLFKGNQEDLTTLKRVGEIRGPFDIIIDDCSHVSAQTMTSYHELFIHHLNPGGTYIIEDWPCQWKANRDIFNYLLNGLAHDPSGLWIRKIHVHFGMFIVQRGKMPFPKREPDPGAPGMKDE